jgi:histidinol-phosphatase (PHP family)
MLDCHIHLEKGPYTTEWVWRFVRQAEAMELEEIWLLEHSHRFRDFAPLYTSMCAYSSYQREWYARRNILALSDYAHLIESCRKERFPIRVKFGLEICYEPGTEELVHRVTKGYPFDFMTGSVHWIDGFAFDHKAEFWAGKDIDFLYGRYYEIMEQLIKSRLFTGVAHPDSIKCFGHHPKADLTETYEKIARLLNQSGMYAEQSGGLRLNYGGQNELGMNERMRAIFLKEGVRLLTASDAHRPENVGANIRELQALIPGEACPNK